MITALLKKKELHFERTYPAPLDAVWRAWTEAERLRAWWGPEQTSVAECEIDARVGGRLYVVMVAGPEMGKYAGTRWPMEGTFTVVDGPHRLTYDARSWTEGEEQASTVCHTNALTLAGDGDRTVMELHVSLTDIGPKAKMAAFGMKWGYASQFDALGKHLAG